MIENSFVINLQRRPDRLEQFTKSLVASGWNSMFPAPQRWDAVDGKLVPHPDYFKSGDGAWGCLRSHVSLLEYCLLKNISSVAVFEDDAVFADDFLPRMNLFLKDFSEIPERDKASQYMFMLGGQHQQGHDYIFAPMTGKAWENILKVKEAHRTHAYVVVGRKTIEELYHLWYNTTAHIDWAFRYFHNCHHTYAPATNGKPNWLVGQAESMSDITGKPTKEYWWNVDDEHKINNVKAFGN